MDKIPRVAFFNELQVLELILLAVDLIDKQTIEPFSFGLDVLEEFGVGGIIAVSGGRRVL